MEHHGEETGITIDNSQLEIHEQVSDEIPAETVEGEVEEIKDTVIETATTEERLEIVVEKSNNEETVSDLPPPRSKSSKHGSKKSHSKQKRDNVEIKEIQTPTEVRNGNGLTEQHANDVPEMTKEEKEVVKDDTHDFTFPASGETNGIIDPTEEAEQIQLTEYAEPTVEDGKIEQEISEEEISVTASVSYNEITRSADKPLEGSEKYLLSFKSSEIHQYKTNLCEEKADKPFSPECSIVSASSLGGNIRSVSARRPVRKHIGMLPERSSISSDRQGNVRLWNDDNHSDTDCSVGTTEGSIASLKRKAVDGDNLSSKKRKVKDSKNSTFFSMVSSPLRLLKTKLSDRILEARVPVAEDILINKNDDESINDPIKKGNNIKETSQFVVAEEVSTQNASLYRSWCSIM